MSWNGSNHIIDIIKDLRRYMINMSHKSYTVKYAVENSLFYKNRVDQWNTEVLLPYAGVIGAGMQKNMHVPLAVGNCFFFSVKY
jgi:hypothetical protein